MLVGPHNFIYFRSTSLMWQIDMYNAIPLCLRQKSMKPFSCIRINIAIVIYSPRESASELLFDFHCFCSVSAVPEKKAKPKRTGKLFATNIRLHISRKAQLFACSGVSRVSVNNIWCDHKSRLWLLFTGGPSNIGWLMNDVNERYNGFDLFVRIF